MSNIQEKCIHFKTGNLKTVNLLTQ